jgi:hypothetical protein
MPCMEFKPVTFCGHVTTRIRIKNKNRNASFEEIIAREIMCLPCEIKQIYNN